MTIDLATEAGQILAEQTCMIDPGKLSRLATLAAFRLDRGDNPTAMLVDALLTAERATTLDTEIVAADAAYVASLALAARSWTVDLDRATSVDLARLEELRSVAA